jgi:hypothetical protein
MANMAWAVERIIESPIGRPINRSEEYLVSRGKIEPESWPTPSETTSTPQIEYRLASRVPDHWIPLLPKETSLGRIGLQRYAMLRNLGGGSDGPPKREQIKPQGMILEPDKDLILREEEVPRAGAAVTRAYQYTRWSDGSVHLWIGRKKRIGRGEGTSGLYFDFIEEGEKK